MNNYDDWKLHTPDNDLKVWCNCSHCKLEIIEGEEYFEVDGEDIHDVCLEEYALGLINPILKVAGKE